LASSRRARAVRVAGRKQPVPRSSGSVPSNHIAATRYGRQPEAVVYDRNEIRRATGIAMPALPAGMQIGDVQLYPSTYGNLVQVSLLTSRGERVSLVAMQIETPAGTKPVLADHSNEHIAYWENGQFAFALVGNISTHRLLILASQFVHP
jgi:hypothetical protein